MVTCIIVSIVLNLIIGLIRHFF
ncbi:hypothetical protein [Spirosoma telluris]